jgi:Tol biopolymer transport system component
MLVAAALDSGARTRIVESDSTNVAYSQGHLLFLRGTTLMAVPFDATRLSVIGEPTPLVENIQTIGSPYSGVFSASPAGVLAYHTGSASIGSRLAWVDRTGKVLSTIGELATYSDVELSPDGRRALASIIDPLQMARDVWVVDLARGLRSRLTFDSREDFAAIWSPDGNRILFGSDRRTPGVADMYLKASTGTGSEELAIAGNFGELPSSWSHDGRFVLYGAGGDIFVLPMSGERKPSVFLQTPFIEGMAAFSPDGRWVAYVSNESGRPEVYVVPFQGGGGKWMISGGGGSLPRWRHDGREILYYSPENRLMAAAVDGTGTGFGVGAVQPLFEVSPGNSRKFYDVSPDGRLLVNLATDTQTGATPITVVVNWAAAMQK